MKLTFASELFNLYMGDGCPMTAEQILIFMDTHLLSLFSDILDLSLTLHDKSPISPDMEVLFDHTFRIGPGGVSTVLPCLTQAHYVMVKMQYSDTGLAPSDLEGTSARLRALSEAFLRCLDHLREKHHRSLWDPKGFRDFGQIYKRYEQRMMVCDSIDERAPWLTSHTTARVSGRL